MNELIKALHVIKDECKKHDLGDCAECPLSNEDACMCKIKEKLPANWTINDEVQKALL